MTLKRTLIAPHKSGLADAGKSLAGRQVLGLYGETNKWSSSGNSTGANHNYFFAGLRLLGDEVDNQI
jgi:hypothetical protein